MALDFSDSPKDWDFDFERILGFKEYEFYVEEQKAGIEHEVLYIQAEGAANTYHRHALEVARDDAPFRFLDLPAEIRRETYKYSLKDVYGLKCDQVRYPSVAVKVNPFRYRGIFNRALLKTCKQIRHEAIPFALTSNVIHFPSWAQAMLAIRLYGLQLHKRAYSIRIVDSLHCSEYYGPDSDVSQDDFFYDFFHEPQFVRITEFAELYPHINIELEIYNIRPWDLVEVEGKEYNDGWYSFLFDWWQRHPTSSLKLTFSPHLDSWDTVDCRSHYPEVKRKLTVFGKKAITAGWQKIEMRVDR